MKIKSILVGSLATIITSSVLPAQIVISDFSDLASQSPLFSGSWLGGSPTSNQFVQESGFVSITPVNGGSPTETGAFDISLGSSISLNSQPNISLTARFDDGNSDSNISVSFTDGDFNTASANFAGFNTSTFSSVSIARTSFAGGGSINWSDITGWAIGGGNPSGSAAVRWSLDSLTAVPEPSTYALMALGGLVLFFIARRRKAQA